jgi:hypothetical protein
LGNFYDWSLAGSLTRCVSCQTHRRKPVAMMLMESFSQEVSADEVYAYQELSNELHGLDEHLRAMVDVYEETPRLLDDGQFDVAAAEIAVSMISRTMRSRVYTDNSPLRANQDVWDAFKEHKREFIFFHRSVIIELETYNRVLTAYRRICDDFALLPRSGHLENFRRDTQTLAEAREACVEAISNFHGKFSAMLAIL